jgi:hypothetical protein
MRRRGQGLGHVALLVLVGLTGSGLTATLGAVGSPASAATEPTGPTVLVGCLGVDPGATGPQIRVGFVTSGPDGLYRAVFAGPSGPVQGEGRVAGGRGLVIVPSTGPGDYDDLVLTDVDTGQSVDRGPLGDSLPFAVGDGAVACDPAALVVATGDTTPTTIPTATASTVPTPDPTGAPTPDISTAAPAPVTATSTTTDTPPWLLLLIPGVLLAAGGIFLVLRGRSDSRSRPAT